MAFISKLRHTLLPAVALSGILIYAHDAVFTFVTFGGKSMQPIIDDNDVGVCEKLTPFKKIRR